ncbi:hypothetical protein [Rossellomorea aquimaris]|uniref:hypothetical protein n=1 Tax=Rossellomorea aquimaris TaxID=189382 RepID=UPI0005CB3569|nr:hypothetical protein [Rossellomorea aquimaris]
MGLNFLCDCHASAEGEGCFSICNFPFNFLVDYSFNLDICREFLPDNSTVNATFSVSGCEETFIATFTSTDIGMPLCTVDEDGDQTMTVMVEGILTIGEETFPVSFELMVSEKVQQVFMPIELPSIGVIPVLNATVVFG